MGTLNWQWKVEHTRDDGSIGGTNLAGTVTYTGRVEKRVTIAASTAYTIWDPTVATYGGPADFDYLELNPSVELELEMTINEGHASEELISLTLPASKPFFLFSDTARYGHSASDAFSGTLDVIDKIRVKEINAATGFLDVLILT